MKTLRTAHGFSLVQVLMMVAIISAISAGTMAMISSTMKSQKALMLNDDLKNTVADVRIHLSKGSVCSANLNNLSSKTFDRTQLANARFTVNRLANPANGETILTNNAPLPRMANASVNMTLQNLKEVAANKSYMGELIFIFDTDRGNLKISSGPRHLMKKMVVIIETTNSGNIQTMTSCSAFDSNALAFEDIDNINRDICLKMGGSYNNGSCDLQGKICQIAGGHMVNGVCNTDNIKAAMCASLGGNWNGSACSYTPPDVRGQLATEKPSICSTLGGSWNGSACTLPEKGVTRIDRGGCGELNMENGLGGRYGFAISACSDDNGGG